MITTTPTYSRSSLMREIGEQYACIGNKPIVLRAELAAAILAEWPFANVPWRAGGHVKVAPSRCVAASSEHRHLCSRTPLTQRGLLGLDSARSARARGRPR